MNQSINLLSGRIIEEIVHTLINAENMIGLVECLLGYTVGVIGDGGDVRERECRQRVRVTPRIARVLRVERLDRALHAHHLQVGGERDNQLSSSHVCRRADES